MKDFDVNFYLTFYDDVRRVYNNTNVLNHYKKYGIREGRLPNENAFMTKFPNFDHVFYKSYYPDLFHMTKIDLMKHYYFAGIKENRFICIEDVLKSDDKLNLSYYKIFNGDLSKRSNIELIKHYINKGSEEDRITNKEAFHNKYPEFDLEYYREFNKDLNYETEFELMYHYHIIGLNVNKLYFQFDFNVNDDIKRTSEYFGRVFNGSHIRKITTYEQLTQYISKYLKKYYIYSRESFYKLYPDFDYNYYKLKYCPENYTEFEVLSYYHNIGLKEKHTINNRKKFIIYTPPYHNKCGGIVVLHYLAKLINEYDPTKYYAKIFEISNLRYMNDFCIDFASPFEINDNTIVIYPEIISNNPLNAKNIVRWILLELGIEMPLSHANSWGKNDYIYHWESSMDTNRKQLCCPYFNNIFKNENKKPRTETCYMIKKGRLIHKNINFIHPNNSIEIKENTDLTEIKNIFNKCKYFYCYDPNSMYIIYAAVCGCVPIIYPIKDISANTYFSSRLMNHKGTIYNKGMVYGNNINDINKELQTIHDCEEYYKNLFDMFKITVNNFLEVV